MAWLQSQPSLMNLIPRSTRHQSVIVEAVFDVQDPLTHTSPLARDYMSLVTVLFMMVFQTGNTGKQQ